MQWKSKFRNGRCSDGGEGELDLDGGEAEERDVKSLTIPQSIPYAPCLPLQLGDIYTTT